MRILFLLTLSLILCSPRSHAQETPPTLEERMSDADFQASGLDRLSPEQLAHLNQWLTVHEAAGGASASGRGFYSDADARETIETRITGTFTGWMGNTVFQLDNGQSWRQAESGRFYTGSMTNPAVTIKPMILNSWLMKIEGCGCSVRVQRVK